MKASKLFILSFISFCTMLAAVSACSRTETDEISDHNMTAAPTATADVYLSEFWADGLKPVGYSDNIGSVLALMLDANRQDQAREYDVLIALPSEASLENVSKVCDTSSWRVWDPVGTLLARKSCYITKLTADTVAKLAESFSDGQNTVFYYIGSGKIDGNHEYLSTEWIASACEQTGDQVVFDANGNVVYSPDIMIEDSSK
ncbi:MAG: hypothetical protein IKZ82_07735 [Clostridia bacterium]|nr:hypothetical protein [Clostridia bacterium]